MRAVRYDQRGHGRSTWGSPGAPVSVDLLGDDLGALLDQLVPSGPVVLGGHSMGGMAIMALAAAPGRAGLRVTAGPSWSGSGCSCCRRPPCRS